MKPFIIAAFILIAVSCAHKESGGKQRIESLEIYKTLGTSQKMEAGPMTHHESSVYEGKRKMSTSYFDDKAMLKGKEVFQYHNDIDTVPDMAEYFDDQQKILSYYRYIKNKKGQMIANYAFDASNDELLRVEQYTYTKDKLTNKRIFDAQLNPSRRYAFTHDMYGNEIGFQVYNAQDSLVVFEEFKITKKDAANKWIEKWGFSKGQPMTLHKRK